MNLSSFRQDYQQNTLTKDKLNIEPFKQLESWLSYAKQSKQPLANAMTLATSNQLGRLSIRTVLLQSIEREKLYFYTNYHSQKADDIANNKQVALSFFWANIERQIHILGSAEKTSFAQSKQYFATRPRESQLGAWASKQSQIISSRQTLEDRYQYYVQKFSNKIVPMPDFWGGYKINPTSIEFWQGREKRLHDRFKYQKNDACWQILQLSP